MFLLQVCIKVTIINFTVTRSGLEDQVLRWWGFVYLSDSHSFHNAYSWAPNSMPKGAQKPSQLTCLPRALTSLCHLIFWCSKTRGIFLRAVVVVLKAPLLFLKAHTFFIPECPGASHNCIIPKCTPNPKMTHLWAVLSEVPLLHRCERVRNHLYHTSVTQNTGWKSLH